MSNDHSAGLSGTGLPAAGAIALAIMWGAVTLLAIYEAIAAH